MALKDLNLTPLPLKLQSQSTEIKRIGPVSTPKHNNVIPQMLWFFSANAIIFQVKGTSLTIKRISQPLSVKAYF